MQLRVIRISMLSR